MMRRKKAPASEQMSFGAGAVLIILKTWNFCASYLDSEYFGAYD